jgi:hypothetical protein
MKKPAIKKGIAGILYRTNVPKLLVENPTAKEKIRANIKQNVTSGIRDITLNIPISPFLAIIRYKIYIMNKPSSEENSMTIDRTSHTKGRKMVVVIARGAIFNSSAVDDVLVTPILNAAPS